MQLNPASLLVDVNIRHDIKLDKDFIASIKEHGVLVPVTAVRTASGDIRVRFGHRRIAAAVQAGLPAVPVDVIGNEGADDAAAIERIVTQHAENTHRASLTAAEKVDVVAQLSAFGVKPTEITKKTRIAKSEVKAANAVAGSELAKQATARYDFLTLDQAAAVAEFEEDGEAVKALVLAATNGRFEHKLQQLREDREQDACIAKATAQLTEAGITIIDRPGWNDPAKTLRQLSRPNKELTDEDHAGCPGHAAFVEAEYDYGDEEEDDEGEVVPDPNAKGWVAEVTFVCTDPVANGHEVAARRAVNGTRASANPGPSEAAEEAARAERKKVLDGNKAWRASEVVRRDWLRGLLTKKSAPKGAQQYIAGELLTGHYELRKALESKSAFAYDLLGIEDSSELMTDAQALIASLAVVLAAYEQQTGPHTWRPVVDANSARYLSQLVEWGYEASEIEQGVIDAGKKDSE
jgi:ParB family chromosome partitioning protein